jgi:hypothetical protein
MTYNTSVSFICEDGKVSHKNAINAGTNVNPTVGAFGLKNGSFSA